jgi:hypothetical protein
VFQSSGTHAEFGFCVRSESSGVDAMFSFASPFAGAKEVLFPPVHKTILIRTENRFRPISGDNSRAVQQETCAMRSRLQEFFALAAARLAKADLVAPQSWAKADEIA